MSIATHTWEAMVTHARNLKPEVGTTKAIRYAMQAARVGFADEDTEYLTVIAMEIEINGPRSWPTVQPLAFKRLDPGPAVNAPIRMINLPYPERAWCSEAYAAGVRKLFVFTDRSRIIRNAQGKPKRDPMAPIPGQKARIVSVAVKELADKVNGARI